MVEAGKRSLLKKRQKNYVMGSQWVNKFIPGLVLGMLLHMFLLNANKMAPEHVEDDYDDEEEEDTQQSFAQPQPGQELKMVLCVNEELKMGKGKVAAQCSHAAVGLVTRLRGNHEGLLRQWETYGQAKICVKAPDLNEMMQIAAGAERNRVPYYLVSDAGRTQIAAGSKTVLAVGPADKGLLDTITGHLKLL